MCAYVYMLFQACVCACGYTCAGVYRRACMCRCVCMCRPGQVCMCRHVCTCAYVCRCVHARAQGSLSDSGFRADLRGLPGAVCWRSPPPPSAASRLTPTSRCCWQQPLPSPARPVLLAPASSLTCSAQLRVVRVPHACQMQFFCQVQVCRYLLSAFRSSRCPHRAEGGVVCN